MLSESVRILNFDDTVIRQKKVLQRFHPVIIDLRKLGPSSRHWLNKKSATEIRKALIPDFKNSITFLGSGDFHQVSGLLIEQFSEPLSLIVFDYHPDWDVFPPRLGCGSWVTSILKRDNIKKVILLGVSSGDISSLSVETGNLSSLKDNRVQIYPYAHKPTVILFQKVPENLSIRVKRGWFYRKIYWQELKGKDLASFFLDIIKGLDTRRVYLSIDKDCLNKNYSLTNWEEGYFALEDLLLLLKLIKESLDVVGLDIAGDYSFPKAKGIIKAICSSLDHPRDFSAKGSSLQRIDRINEETNIRILELLKC